MESNKSKRRGKAVVPVLLAIAVAISLLYYFARTLHAVRISQFVRGDLPVLELRLRFINMDGEEVAPSASQLIGKVPEEIPLTSGCPELIGGDIRGRTTLPVDLGKRKLDGSCPKVAAWYVRRHPIALSLYFEDSKKILSFLEADKEVRTLFKTKFIQGVFYNLLNTTSARAEDLRLEGLQGAFLGTLIKALNAHAELHYDIAHGKRGFVFSFIRDECPFAAKALPIIARSLARSGYLVPGFQEPILEMIIGAQRLFITQHEERVYLANGLEAFLNVIESLPSSSKGLPNMPLTLTVRAEAFVDKLLPVFVGASAFEANVGFNPSQSPPGVLRLPGGKYVRSLRPRISKGVLGSIPHDVFAVLATSFHLPTRMTKEDWQKFATQGPSDRPGDLPQEAGFALLWDLNSQENQITSIGVIVANQTSPKEVEGFRQYFSNPDLTAECGGGTLFLAATSQNLLSRMKECCEGRSLSVLDWERGARIKELESAQILVSTNPGVGMRELFLAGGAKSGDRGEFEPRWKEEYEKAKEAMRQDGERVFLRLPIFAYSGGAQPLTQVELKGFTVKQGAVP